MKKIYLALLILIIVPVLSWGQLCYTDKKCREVAQVVEFAAEDTGNAENHLKDAEAKWKKLEPGVSVYANHSIVEKINEGFVRAKALNKTGEYSLLTGELKWLSKLIRHIYEAEYPTAYNIF